MKTKEIYTVDLIDYTVYEETDKKLVIENFLDENIDSLYANGDFFTIDITNNILTLEKHDNNKYNFEENINYLLLYYSDIGVDMFDRRTLHIYYKNKEN